MVTFSTSGLVNCNLSSEIFRSSLQFWSMFGQSWSFPANTKYSLQNERIRFDSRFVNIQGLSYFRSNEVLLTDKIVRMTFSATLWLNVEICTFCLALLEWFKCLVFSARIFPTQPKTTQSNSLSNETKTSAQQNLIK